MLTRVLKYIFHLRSGRESTSRNVLCKNRSCSGSSSASGRSDASQNLASESNSGHILQVIWIKREKEKKKFFWSWENPGEYGEKPQRVCCDCWCRTLADLFIILGTLSLMEVDKASPGRNVKSDSLGIRVYFFRKEVYVYSGLSSTM